MTRWKAAGIHLLISLVVISLVAAGLIWVWYGWEFFGQLGGKKLLLLMACIDLVIGPLLTLIVYKRGKPSLKFDLAVIALLQAGFLAYGLHVMSQSRPIFLVAVLDRFEMVFAGELSDEDLAGGSQPAFRHRSWTGPLTVGGRAADSSNREDMNLALEGLMTGRDIQHMPDRYVPYEDVAAGFVSRAEPLANLEKVSPEAPLLIEKAVERAGVPRERVVFTPVISSRGRAAMLLEAETGRLLGAVAVDPWAEIAVE